MDRRSFGGAAALVALTAVAPALAEAGSHGVEHAPPGGGFQPVSKLVKLPNFLPGLGTLYVDPKTLPAGPFLAYDHKGRLVSTIYMIPLKDLDAQKEFADLAAPGDAKVDHVSLYFNAGHPGVPEPHYHIILWHITVAEQARVAK
ncbi:MAG TPA: DUF5602 domain-containing protein [Acidiphilium sp.]